MRLKEQKYFLYLAGFMSLLTLSGTAGADYLPLPARISANGYASDCAVGQADLMLPLRGDERHNFYIDPGAVYATDKQGHADLGLGYRWSQKQAAILGVYLFGSYTRIDNDARFFVINPGIEALGSRWDMHLNGYVPMGIGNSKVLYSTTNSEPSFDPPYTRLFFSGHSQILGTFTPVTLQTTRHYIVHYAPVRGADIKLAYQPLPGVPVKAYLGSYFFAISQNNSVWGGATGLEYWANANVKIFASYTYDNLRRNTGALGMGIEFGGTHVRRSDPLIEERITDPVEHYLGELGRGSGLPSRRQTYNTVVPIGAVIETDEVLMSDIAFFSQTGGPNNGGVGLTLASCTFEHPCGPADLTNAGTTTLATLLPNTLLWFNGGSYGATNIPGGSSGVTVQLGQSVSSRTPDYTQLAMGTERSTFNGAFVLSDNSALINVILLPTPVTATSTAAVSIPSISNFLITGSQIGSPPGDHSFVTGIRGGSPDNSGLITNNQIFTLNASLLNDLAGTVLTINDSTAVTTTAEFQEIHAVIASNGGSILIGNSHVEQTSNPVYQTNLLDASGSSFIRVTGGSLTLTANNDSYIASGDVTTMGGTICMKDGFLVSCP